MRELSSWIQQHKHRFLSVENIQHNDNKPFFKDSEGDHAQDGWNAKPALQKTTLKSWQVEANAISMSIPCYYHWKIKEIFSIDLPPCWPAASFISAYFSLTLMACSRSNIKSCASSMPTDSLALQYSQGVSSLHRFQEYLGILKRYSSTKLLVEEFMLLEKHDWIEGVLSFLRLLIISISNV